MVEKKGSLEWSEGSWKARSEVSEYQQFCIAVRMNHMASVLKEKDAKSRKVSLFVGNAACLNVVGNIKGA